MQQKRSRNAAETRLEAVATRLNAVATQLTAVPRFPRFPLAACEGWARAGVGARGYRLPDGVEAVWGLALKTGPREESSHM